MLNKIVFTNQSGVDAAIPIDIGRLVESMIFYKTTYVVADKRMLSCLIAYFGVENLLLLIGGNNLVIYYCDSMLVLQSQAILGQTYHKPMYLNASVIELEYVIDEIFQAINLRSDSLVGLKYKIMESVGIYEKSNTISSLTDKAFANTDFILNATKTIISKHVVMGANLNDVKIRLIPTELGALVETNIDFFSSKFHEKTTEASILSRILSVEWTLEVASRFNSSLVLNSLDSKICSQKINTITSLSTSNESNISNFIAYILNNEKDIQSGVNNAIVSVSDVMRLIENSNKFRNWISDLNDDRNILKEYYREVSKPHIKDKLPSKSLRFTFFTGAGLALDCAATGGLATAASLGLGALDAFLLDKLIGGWKPDQFVSNELSIFNGISK